ncbi:hypothetical protein SFRURICE_012963 [Spodoptera frugiperda]|nr:hypothetical protein SFRURICE_012963 [Spodoptera frugiperda]
MQFVNKSCEIYIQKRYPLIVIRRLSHGWGAPVDNCSHGSLRTQLAGSPTRDATSDKLGPPRISLKKWVKNLWRHTTDDVIKILHRTYEVNMRINMHRKSQRTTVGQKARQA